MFLKRIVCALKRRVKKYFYWFINREPITFLKVNRRNDLVEIGSRYGGWVVPKNLINSQSICYCVGCGEDITFDIGLIEKFGCDVYAFDPTPRAISHVEKVASDIDKYHFYDIGLWDKKDQLKFYVPENEQHVSHSIVNLQKTDSYIEINVDRLSSVMKELKHTKLDLLKLDIEGAEYKVLESIVKDKIDIRILCVEYDECFKKIDEEYKDRISASMKSLIEYGYTLVCVQSEGNYTFVKL